MVHGIFTALEADYDLSYSVLASVLEEEFEATVVQTLKQRKMEVSIEGRPVVVESPAGIILKARVRKAYKLCFELANGKPTTESSGLNDLQAQMVALAAAVAQGCLATATRKVTAARAAHRVRSARAPRGTMPTAPPLYPAAVAVVAAAAVVEPLPKA